MLSGCNVSLAGAPGVSLTVEESKRRGVFLYEIKPDCVNVKYGWVEQQWWFSG